MGGGGDEPPFLKTQVQDLFNFPISSNYNTLRPRAAPVPLHENRCCSSNEAKFNKKLYQFLIISVIETDHNYDKY